MNPETDPIGNEQGPQQLDQQAPAQEQEQDVGARKTPTLRATEANEEMAPGEDYATTAGRLSPGSGSDQRMAAPRSFPLPNEFASAFDVDLSGVMVHFNTGLPDKLGVEAFTEDDDIYLAKDAPDLKSPEGRRLIGHELSHVVQQRKGADEGAEGGGDAAEAREGEAEAAGQDVAAGNKPDVEQGAAEPGAPQARGGGGPSQTAIDNARKRNSESGVNRTGNFNVAGTSTGKDYEFVNRGGKYYVRAKPQATKDRNTVAGQGEDPNSTKKPIGVEKEAKLGIWKGEKKASVYSTKEGGETLAEGKAGKLTAEADVLKVSAGAEVSGGISKDGVEVKAGANVGITLVGGKLCWTLPSIKFDILGEQMEAIFGTELSAEVAASAKGEVGLKVGKGEKGVKVGASAGGEAFAGAKAGFKLFGKGMWNTKKKPEDILGAYAGVEGWAGAAAAAKFTANLLPSMKFEGYLGAAVGIGASCKVGVEAQVVNIARLGYILAKKGLPMAWEGLQQYAGQVHEWLADGAAELYDIGSQYIDSVSTSLLGDSETIKLVDKGLHKHMSPKDRGGLITKLISGTCFNAEEDAVLKVLRYSKGKGELWRTIVAVEGGLSAIQWALDGSQDTELNKLTG